MKLKSKSKNYNKYNKKIKIYNLFYEINEWENLINNQ